MSTGLGATRAPLAVLPSGLEAACCLPNALILPCQLLASASEQLHLYAPIRQSYHGNDIQRKKASWALDCTMHHVMVAFCTCEDMSVSAVP